MARKAKVAETTGGANPDHAAISALAHQLWMARGCPIGSDLEDWFLAEAMLKSQAAKERPVSE